MPSSITVLQLDTDFPRVPGDVACPDTYQCDLEIIRIPSATVSNIVSDKPENIDIAPFEDAIRKATGDLIVTSCGFLSFWQNHLDASSETPFISSALTAFETLSERFKPDEVLTLTFDEDSLTASHFGHYPEYAVSMVGLPADMHLRQVISENRSTLDVQLATQELRDFISTKQLPRHKHIVLECTNLPPYKAALRSATGLEVSDILTCIETAQQGSIHEQFLSRV